IETMNPDEPQDYLDKNFQIRQINKDRAKTVENNLETNSDHALTVAEQKGYHIKIPKEEKKETISTIKPEPNKCDAYYAAVDIHNRLAGEPDPITGEKLDYTKLWFNLATKLKEYPLTPKDTEATREDREVARFLRTKLQTLESECRMLKSFT